MSKFLLVDLKYDRVKMHA